MPDSSPARFPGAGPVPRLAMTPEDPHPIRSAGAIEQRSKAE